MFDVRLIKHFQKDVENRGSGKGPFSVFLHTLCVQYTGLRNPLTLILTFDILS